MGDGFLVDQILEVFLFFSIFEESNGEKTYIAKWEYNIFMSLSK